MFPTRDEDGRYYLPYKIDEAEGQCRLKHISPLVFVKWKFVIFILLNVFLLIPFIITFWIQKTKRYFYYDFSRLEEATHFYIVNDDNQVNIVEKCQKVFMISECESRFYIYFKNRYLQYIIDQNETVRLHVFSYRKNISDIINTVGPYPKYPGLTYAQVNQIYATFGPGTMQIYQPNILNLIMYQLLRPLYLFLFFSVSYWFFAQQYFYYAATLFFTTMFTLILNVVKKKRYNKKLYEMAYNQTYIHVLRQGQMAWISSLQVVPGDIVFLKNPQRPFNLTFEGIILQGNVLVNESALTGQSYPIGKKADTIPTMAQIQMSISKRAFLLEGTTIKHVYDQRKILYFEEYRKKGYGIPVYVVKTNFMTFKGQLIRIILFPNYPEKIFKTEYLKFLLFLFFLGTISFTIMAIIISNYSGVNISKITLFQRYIDIVTITVPPGWAISMIFGLMYSVNRLDNKEIACNAQNRIVQGGMVSFCCFDKTGTLTEQQMQFQGVIPCFNRSFSGIIENNPKGLAILTYNRFYNILNNMAANHSLEPLCLQPNIVSLLGDSMQKKMFQFIKYRLNMQNYDSSIVFGFQNQQVVGYRHTGFVIRRFQFDADLKRMSVICKSSDSQKHKLFTKGAPNRIDFLEESIPDNYYDILNDYCKRGYRVLAFGSKIINNPFDNLKRDQFEDNLQFDGFYIFRNKLKDQTKEVINQLKAANIGCAIITGDNSLTASNISYQCGISDQKNSIIICDYKNNRLKHQILKTRSNNPEQGIIQTNRSLMLQQRQTLQDDLENIELYFNEHVNSEGLINLTSNQSYFDKIIELASPSQYYLCITGNAFTYLFQQFLKRDELLKENQVNFMKMIKVFAETRPNQKINIIRIYQRMGWKIGMCGDGVNDSGALKQANIGLSVISKSNQPNQASISAPFSSRINNISSMVDLLIQCRCGLATNFSMFNIMAIYSLIQYTTTLISQKFLQYPGDFHYLYWDICLNFLFVLFIGFTKPSEKLSKEIPRSSLFCFTNLVKIMTAFAIQLAGQIAMIAIFEAKYSDFYYNNAGMKNAKANFNKSKNFKPGFQSVLLFAFTNNLYVVSMMTLNIGRPWRRLFFTNIPLMIIICLTLFYNQVVIFWYSGSLYLHFVVKFIPLEIDIRWLIFGVSWGFCLGFVVIIKLIVEPLSNKLIEAYPDKNWL